MSGPDRVLVLFIADNDMLPDVDINRLKDQTKLGGRTAAELINSTIIRCVT